MNSIRVYHISDQNFGPKVKLFPRIPDSIASDIHEDNQTPRICCALTLPQCLYSTERTYDITEGDKKIKLYVYEATVKASKLYQPNENQVFDTYYTGELWLLDPTVFTLVNSYTLKRQQILGYPYSRFSFTMDGEDEVIDKYVCDPIYGDSKAFSFIAVDRYRILKKVRENSTKYEYNPT